MPVICVYENQTTGKVKPMHAVNNGPVYKSGGRGITNIDAYRDAGIPYARNHDAALYSAYGGEHIVDVCAVFPDFDADAYDEASYDFVCTDEYLRVIDYAGAKTFYRLGSKIEHSVKKYGTLPPADYKKWAVICEHIIRHYTEGWADGFYYNIEYWEIWNEPDLDGDDSKNKRTWGGTQKEFFEFYDVAATYLKQCFPGLKIGGPALAYNEKWAEEFLKQLKAPLDFFSWHAYGNTVEQVINKVYRYRELLDAYGFSKTESILDEWNYVEGWTGEEWRHSIQVIKGLKGASFAAGVMCAGQNSPLDMLMYYDARPCAMNGMFHTDLVCENLKGYFPFKMFHVLYKKGEAILTDAKDAGNIYVAAARNQVFGTSILLTYFDDEEKADFCDVELRLCDDENSMRIAEIYLLDQPHDMELVRKETVMGKLNLRMSLFSTVLVNLK